MAWNPSSEVAALRDYAAKFKQTKVILLSIDETTGIFGVVSYGKTKQKCSEAKEIADNIYELVLNQTIKVI